MESPTGRGWRLGTTRARLEPSNTDVFWARSVWSGPAYWPRVNAWVPASGALP